MVIANTAPSATVSLGPPAPSTDATLTATATKTDADGNAVGLTFAWSVNGTVRRTVTSSTALTDTFDLSTTGNGDPGDVVQVDVTPADNATSGTPASATVTVGGRSGPVTHALDTFGRNVVDSFGSANPGGSYSLLGTAADYDVGGATGTIALATAGATRAAVLASVAARDVDLSSARDKQARDGQRPVYLRRGPAGAGQRVVPDKGPDCARRCGLGRGELGRRQRRDGDRQRRPSREPDPDPERLHPGTSRGGLNGPGDDQDPGLGRRHDGTRRVDVHGTNSVAALQAPGGVGLQAYLSSSTTNAPVVVTVDDLRAADLGAP